VVTWQALIAWLLDAGWSPAAVMVFASSCRLVMKSGEAVEPLRSEHAVRLVLDSPSYRAGKPPLLSDPDVVASGEGALGAVAEALRSRPDVAQVAFTRAVAQPAQARSDCPARSALRLTRKPSTFSLSRSVVFEQAFPWMGSASRLWEEWLKSHEPDDDQVLRKLLLDLLPEFEAKRHQGEEFSTVGGWARYRGFNDYVSRPIECGADYSSLVAPLLSVLHFSKPDVPADTIAEAVLRFIISGEVHPVIREKALQAAEQLDALPLVARRDLGREAAPRLAGPRTAEWALRQHALHAQEGGVQLAGLLLLPGQLGLEPVAEVLGRPEAGRHLELEIDVFGEEPLLVEEVVRALHADGGADGVRPRPEPRPEVAGLD
jgi:hypothetical protein